MKLSSALLSALFPLVLNVLLAGDQSGEKPVPDARFGDVWYRTPDPAQWTVRDGPDRRVYAADLPAPDFCTVTIFADRKLEGDFATSFDHAIAQVLHELHSDTIVSDNGVQSSQAAEGFPVLQRVLVCAAPDFHTVHWFLAGHPADRFDLIAFETSSEEMYRYYGAQAAAFFQSVKLASSLPAGAGPVARPSTSPAASSGPHAFGPLAVGDAVEVPWAGGWTPGVVRHIEGLTYFVHYGTEEDAGKYDDFFTLNLVRPPGGPKTYAEMFRGTAPDPLGGPLELGAEIEFVDYLGRWNRGRVARRLAERYVVFTDAPGEVSELWLTLDKLRRPGAAAPLAAEQSFRPRQPAVKSEIQIGDLVEAKPVRGDWRPLTVLAQAGSGYFVKIAPNSGMSMRGWVGLAHMRPVGAQEPFEAEDLSFFVGRWALSGDSFQTIVDRRVSGSTVTDIYENNSGAGQSSGVLIVNADGTYELRNTTVYHDGSGRWRRNPNQDEGGIILIGADDAGRKDGLMTNHEDGFGYFQGAFRGPGKWCTRLP